MTAKTAKIGEWLQTYPGRGRSCMPSPHNAKKPILGQWQNLSLTDTDLPESFNGKNIVLQHLVDRIPVQPKHAGRLPNAHPFNEVGPTNSPVHIHGVHPSSLPSQRLL